MERTGCTRRPEIAAMSSWLGISTSQLKRLRDMKRTYSTVKISVLTVAFFLYLFLGAILFSYLENENQVQSFEFLFKHIGEFYRENEECVDLGELSRLVMAIVRGCEQGIHFLPFNNNSDIIHGNITGKWNMANSFFFSATVVTTIGYGRLAPQTHAGRGACIIYALLGIPLTALLISEVGRVLKYRTNWCIMKLSKVSLRVSRNENFIKIATWSLVVIILYCFLIGLPALAFSYSEGWKFSDAHYFCFITLTTIGFGDMVAGTSSTGNGYHHVWTRWIFNFLATIYFLSGLSALAVLFNSVSQGGMEKLSVLKGKGRYIHGRLSQIFNISLEEPTPFDAVTVESPATAGIKYKKNRRRGSSGDVAMKAAAVVETTINSKPQAKCDHSRTNKSNASLSPEYTVSI